MKRKYELSNDSKLVYVNLNGNVTLHRIRALRSFDVEIKSCDSKGTLVFPVKKGELGGWVQSEENLSQEGMCWIARDAMAFEHSSVTESAYMTDSAAIRGHAIISGNAVMSNNSSVSGHAHLSGHAVMHNNSVLVDNAVVDGDVCMDDNSHVYGHAHVSDMVWMTDESSIFGNAHVYERVWLYGRSRIYGHADVSGNILLDGNVNIYDDAIVNIYGLSNDLTAHSLMWDGRIHIGLGAHILRCEDILHLGPLGSRHDFITFYRNRRNGVNACCGCWSGEVKDLLIRIDEIHDENPCYREEYHIAIETALRLIGEGRDRNELLSTPPISKSRGLPHLREALAVYYKDYVKQ
jgi:carbonic anhydrase/acetyltransferase-like protein (isoleucine patch superfamily)